MKPNTPSLEGSEGHNEAETQEIWGYSGHTGLKWRLSAKPRAVAGHVSPHEVAEQHKKYMSGT